MRDSEKEYLETLRGVVYELERDIAEVVNFLIDEDYNIYPRVKKLVKCGLLTYFYELTDSVDERIEELEESEDI